MRESSPSEHPPIRPPSPGAESPGGGVSPSLCALFAQARQASRIEQIALVRADQFRRWPRGERVPIEAYLEQFPELQADTEATVDLIYSEALLREQHGEVGAPEDYMQRFPQY